jgi:gluconate 2-dehydrogenase gamma chain
MTLAVTGSLVAITPAQWAMAEQQLMSLPLAEPWLTIDQVQQQLLPVDDLGPAAVDIKALAYLKAVTEQSQMDENSRQFLVDGVGWLNDLSQQRLGVPYTAAQHSQQSELLHEIARTTSGENWLSLLMTYLIEALLSDPVYGANPNAIGWHWLQHTPGFPRPPATKKWYRL